MRKLRILIGIVLIMTMAFGTSESLALTTVKQTSSPVKYGKYKKVNIPKWAYVKQPRYKWWHAYEFRTFHYKSKKGTKADFQRWLMLDLDNPQSITATPDGNTLFVMTADMSSAKKERNRKGYIFRIDVKGIRSDKQAQSLLKSGECLYSYIASYGQDPVKPTKPEIYYEWRNQKGENYEDICDDIYWEALDEDRAKDEAQRQELEKEHSDWYFYDDYCYDPETGEEHKYTEYFTPAVDYDDPTKPYADNFDEEAWKKANGFVRTKIVDDPDFVYRKYIKVSSKMVVGHGQTLAYNPKTKKLWFFPNMKYKNGKAVRINPDTLKKERVITFKWSKGQCPSTLTFDSKGNAYCYAKAGGTNAARILKGTTTNNKIKFRTTRYVINPKPGTRVQGLGYNPKTKRLYLVSDCSIISVPVAKLNKLKKSDVRATIFGGKREFEDICFDNNGQGYFLTNKPDEIMLVNKGF